MKSKGKTWSLGTNLRLPFAINEIINLSKIILEIPGKKCVLGKKIS